jgi:hypothetical protein
MDDHLWVGLCLFHDLANGSWYVHNRREIEKANGEILWNQVGSIARVRVSPVLFNGGIHVPGKADTRKTCLDGQDEAAKDKLALSCLHSWFYPDKIGSPPGNPTGQAR